jgi:Ni,Fe-hydrogenase III small subunit/formate hydrogenlyase subunit 6/NADH:ubiquinone oxidoreductase subunit I
MIKTLIARVRQGHRTFPFPDKEPTLPDRFRGRPVLDASRCPDGCRACAEACPTDAIVAADRAIAIDIGRCLFCTACMDACPEHAVDFIPDYRLASRQRQDLIMSFPPAEQRPSRELALGDELRSLLGRSLKLRQVSAGGCNGCEADVNVLGTIVFDLGRFGIQFVASPRHADGILITGPVTDNMRLALEKTYTAIPEPKIVIAVGACAISGGPYVDHPVVENGADSVVPVDLYVPGCPPHPYTILEGLLGLLGRLDSRAARVADAAERVRRETLETGIPRAESAVRLLGADLGQGAKPEEPG